MFAIATNNGVIKIFNLKGYETEILQAHDCQITFLQFVPNGGILMSVDSESNLKMWHLTDLKLIANVNCGQDCQVTSLYMP
jgi:WD40 repeat protein